MIYTSLASNHLLQVFLKSESNTSSIALSIVLSNSHVNDIGIWHRRLGHHHSNIV